MNTPKQEIGLFERYAVIKLQNIAVNGSDVVTCPKFTGRPHPHKNF